MTKYRHTRRPRVHDIYSATYNDTLGGKKWIEIVCIGPDIQEQI